MEIPASPTPPSRASGQSDLSAGARSSVLSEAGATTQPLYQPAVGVLRVTGMFGVAALHIISLVLQFTDPGTTAWWIANCYDGATRWCVPVFVMISGALLLHPARPASLGAFYRKRLNRILIPLVFWSAFYLGWQAYFSGTTGAVILRDLVRGNPFGHLWFLYMIAGLYFITPILQPFVRGTTRRHQGALAAVLLAAVCAHTLISAFTAGQGKATVFSLFVPYIPYYLCGPVLLHQVVSRRWAQGLAGVITGAWLSIVLGTGLFFPRLEFYLSHHHSPLVIVMSLGVFLLVTYFFEPRRLTGGPFEKILRFLDARSLGVYLIHPVFMLILLQSGLHARYLIPHPLLAIPFVSALVILASLLVTSILLAIPGLRRIV